MDRKINNNTMGGVNRNTSRVLAPPGGRSNICFGEDPPAPNTAASLPKTQVAPPVSAGPADVNTTSAVKTTASSTSTDAFEDSANSFVRNKNKNTISQITF